MGWLVVLVILLLLVFLPIRLAIGYEDGSAFAWLHIGPVHFSIYPRKKIKSDSKKSVTRTKSGSFASYETENKNKKQSSPADFWAIVRIFLDMLGDFRRKLTISDMRLHIVLAGSDPCDVAVNYGRVWSAVGNLMPRIERHFAVKRRDINVSCDFLAEKSLFDARLVISISLGDILSLGIYHGVRILRKYLKIMKNSKAVQ